MSVLLSKLQHTNPNGSGYDADCPVCGDTKRHLSIAPGKNGGIVLTCFKGCKTDDIMKSIGLKMSDLFPDKVPQPKAKRVKVKEMAYDIVDRKGTLQAQHIRIEHNDGSKTFQWRRDGATGLQGLRVENLPLYGWQWFDAMAEESSSPVIVTEGEKAATALHNAGYLALATITGAASCPSEDSLVPLLLFAGRVYLWPDNDEQGHSHMNKVAVRLARVGILPSVIKWPNAPLKADAYDYLTSGHNVEELIEQAEVWGNKHNAITIENDVLEQEVTIGSHSITFRAADVRKEKTGVHARIDISADGEKLAWDTFNIGRDADRVRIANSAHKQLSPELAGIYTAANLKKGADDFCASLWDKHIEYNIGKMMSGKPIPYDQKFTLKPFIIAKGGTLIFAPPGRGKSYLAMLMAVSIDANYSGIWEVSQPGRVLYINLERSPESMAHRLARVNEALGFSAERSLIFLNARGRSLNDIADAAADTIDRFGIKTVFLDSISRSGMGDLNENQPANRIIDTMNRIAPTWLAIAHTPRATEDHLFGSMHFEAGADVIVRVITQEKDDDIGLGLQITKANDIKKPKMMCYALSFNGIGLCGARKAKQGEFGELYIGIESSLTDEVTNYLLEMGEATATQISDGIGKHRQSVVRLISSGNQFVKTHKTGRDQFYGLADNHGISM